MKYLFIFFVSSQFYKTAFSQKNNTIIKFTFDTINFDNPKYETNETTINGKILKVIIRDNETKKQKAEFLRINDKSYYYKEFDSTHSIITEGKAIVESKPCKIIKTPIFMPNGEMNGNKSYNFYILKKVGIWNEKITDSTSCFGKYLNKEKDSTWTYSKSINKNISVLEKQILYKKGVAISEKSLNLFTKSITEIQKEILGSWSVFSDYNPNDTIISFHKIKDKNYSKILLVFYPNGECKITGRSIHRNNAQIYNWKIEKESINIKLEFKTLFKIENLNKEYFILRIK